MSRTYHLVAPGVERYDGCHWGYILSGTKEALIASGHAKAEWFVQPDERNARGQCVRQRRLTVGDRLVHTRLPARGVAEVCVYYTPAEVDAIRLAEPARRIAHEEHVDEARRRRVAALEKFHEAQNDIHHRAAFGTFFWPIVDAPNLRQCKRDTKASRTLREHLQAEVDELYRADA